MAAPDAALAETHFDNIKHLLDLSRDLNVQLPRIQQLLKEREHGPGDNERPSRRLINSQTQTIDSAVDLSLGSGSQTQQQPFSFLFRHLPSDGWQRQLRFPGTAPGDRPQETSVAELMTLFDDVAHADAYMADAYIAQSDNMLRMFRTAQMMLQVMAHKQRQLQEQMRTVLEKGALVDRFIEGMKAIDIDPIPSLASHAAASFQKLEAHDVNEMFAKIRAEGLEQRDGDEAENAAQSLRYLQEMEVFLKPMRESLARRAEEARQTHESLTTAHNCSIEQCNKG